MAVQELDELMQWLSDFGVRSAAFDRLRELLQGEQSVGMNRQPSLATAVENVAALREELHMTDSQVRPMSGGNPTYSRAKWVNCMVRSGASVRTTSVSASFTCMYTLCRPCVHVCELTNSTQSPKPVLQAPQSGLACCAMFALEVQHWQTNVSYCRS